MLDLSTPQRQSKKSIILYLLKGIKSVVAYFIFGFFGSRSMGEWYFIGFSIFMSFVALIGPFIRYYFFKFHIDGDEFIINKGWLQKENKAVPLERIQSININQNLLQRILGIASLEVDTAGSKAKELEIPGLERSYADQLKNLLNEKKNEIQQDLSPESESEEAEGSSEHTHELKPSEKASVEHTPVVILDLSFADLIKVGFTQNHLRSGFVAMGLVAGFWFQVKDVIERYFSDYMDKISLESTIKTATLSFLIFFVIAFLIVSVIISLVTVLNKYWGYRITKQHDYLEVEMGLLNRSEIKVPLNKIQLLEFHSNPLRKILGFYTGKIFQAQSVNTKATSINVPACKEEQMVLLQKLIFEEEIDSTAGVELQPNPWSHARLQFYITGSISFLGSLAAWFFDFYWIIAAFAAFLILSVFMAYKYGRYSKLERNDSFVVFYKGWVFNSIIISPIYKTQAVEKWRSIFLKRRRECHINIHTAAGTRGLKYLKDNQVTRFLNHINNQVLVDDRKWM
ncbi:MAG: PH domain-containing protein [Nonlabens sp.]